MHSHNESWSQHPAPTEEPKPWSPKLSIKKLMGSAQAQRQVSVAEAGCAYLASCLNHRSSHSKVSKRPIWKGSPVQGITGDVRFLWAKTEIGFYREWACNGLPKSHWVSTRTWSTELLWAGRDPLCSPSCPPGDSSSHNSSRSCSPLQKWVAPSRFWHSQCNPWSQGNNSHLCFPLRFIPLAMIQLSCLLSAGSWCLKKQKPQHMVLWSCCWKQGEPRTSHVDGSSSSGGHVSNPPVKPAAQTDAEVHQWAKSRPCLFWDDQ